ncbi:MAG: membrane protein insertase YidC [Chitinispirillaceae bacterium]|nr:membrane protein insertase YidC [Chitinispirillaceae bacterium]
MNRNTILAFLIIFGAVFFFTSPTYNKFYVEKILKQKYIPPSEYYKKRNLQSKVDTALSTQKQDSGGTQIKENASLLQEEDSIKTDTVWVDNGNFIVGITEKGALISKILMKKYIKEGKKINIIESNNSGGLQLTIGNKCFDKNIFKFKGENKNIEIKNDKEELIFETEDENGTPLKKIFEIRKNDYVIKVKIERKNLKDEKIKIGWYCGISESEKTDQKNQTYQKKIHLFTGKSTEHFVLSKEEKDERTGEFKWVGITSKYFLITLNNEDSYDSDIKIKKIKEEKEENYKIEIERIAVSDNEIITIYAGPKEREELKKYKQKYEKVLFPVTGWTKIFFWADKWFPPLAEFVLILLLKIQAIVKDFGIAIIIVTIIMRIVTYPLVRNSMKSMEKMKELQPKIEKIRQKYKNSPQKLNEELMALYRKEGINPLNPGCLPIFLQMPIFISLFVVLQDSIEIRGKGTILFPWIKDLSLPESLISLQKIFPNGIPMYGKSIALLPIIMAILTYFQQKSTIKDPNQKALVYLMPIMMLVLFNNFPSGLVLYWTFSSALQVLQQFITDYIKKRKKI